MKNWFKVFIIFLFFGLLIYFNALNNKFLMDDYLFINNPVLCNVKYVFSQWDPFSQQAISFLDKQGPNPYFRPMAHIFYDFTYGTFKNNYWEFHLLNLVLFAFAASLINLFLVKVFKDLRLAFLVSLLYFIHPINGIIVDYISAGVFALEVIFILSTILILLESLERNNNQFLYAISLVFCFLTLFWHESGVMVPFYVAAVILFFRNDSLHRKIMYLFPYFIIPILYLSFRFILQGSNELMFKQLVHFHVTMPEGLAAFFRLIIWYISQLLCPNRIVLQWVTPFFNNYLFLEILGFISLIVLSLLFYFKLSQSKICKLAILWIWIGFLPATLAAFRVPKVGALIEPHWFVFSSIGFFILLAYFFIAVMDKMKKIGLTILIILILTWSSASFAYNQLWLDQLTYAKYWSQHVPNLKLTYFYLAEAYQKGGDLKQSGKYYRWALMGDPSDFQIYNNLGIIEAQDRHFNQAEINYKIALKINPSSGAAYNNLGTLYELRHQWQNAKESFIQAIKMNPYMLVARVNLAKILLKEGKFAESIELCRKNLEVSTYDQDSTFLLIDLYYHQKNLASVRQMASLLIKNESNCELLMKLGDQMAQMNIFEKAIDCYTKVLKEEPNNKEAYLGIGLLLEKFGRYDDAIQIFKLGSSIDIMDQRFIDQTSLALKLKMRK